MMKIENTVLLFFFLIYFMKIESCSDCNMPYEAPHNVKFPYGDENLVNVDVSTNDTNTVICSDSHKLAPANGRCPFPPEDPGDMKLTNPYVRCPDFPELIAPGNIALGEPIPPAIVQCQNCDLKLTEDNTAVLLKCIGCYDLPSTDRTANYSEKELLYKVFFIGIANYTSVDIQGRENF